MESAALLFAGVAGTIAVASRLRLQEIKKENNSPDGILRNISKVAQSAARDAGAVMRENCGLASVKKTKFTAKDLVTIVDQQCQKIVESYIEAAFPSHQILGEEDVAPGAKASTEALNAKIDSEYLWIIDPIDGTTNFVHGLPLSVVSIAVAHKGEVVVGVIYDPYRDELYSAIRGGGAFLNGTSRLSVRSETLGEALLTHGLNYTAAVRVPMLRAVSELAYSCRAIRGFGTAALHLAWVAAGRVSAFWELDLNSWDIAAGALLVQEAGGRVTDTRGTPYNLSVRDVCGSSGGFHDDMLAGIARANATDPEPQPDQQPTVEEAE